VGEIPQENKALTGTNTMPWKLLVTGGKKTAWQNTPDENGPTGRQGESRTPRSIVLLYGTLKLNAY